jgi:hypothetical protein
VIGARVDGHTSSVAVLDEAGHVVRTLSTNVDTGRETGRTAPGQKDCANGTQDPASPAHPDVRVLTQRRTQLRLVPPRALTH